MRVAGAPADPVYQVGSKEEELHEHPHGRSCSGGISQPHSGCCKGTPTHCESTTTAHPALPTLLTPLTVSGHSCWLQRPRLYQTSWCSHSQAPVHQRRTDNRLAGHPHQRCRAKRSCFLHQILGHQTLGAHVICTYTLRTCVATRLKSTYTPSSSSSIVSSSAGEVTSPPLQCWFGRSSFQVSPSRTRSLRIRSACTRMQNCLGCHIPPMSCAALHSFSLKQLQHIHILSTL